MPGPLGLPLEIEDTTPNFIQNGAFIYFQERGANALTNGDTRWVADGWYSRNSMGATSVLTSGAGSTSDINGIRSLSMFVTTAPTATFGPWALFQTLPNEQSRPLMGKVASFAVKAKAIGNVTQIGLQFLYKTTDTRVSIGEPTIGTEALCSVNTGAYSLCQLINQNLGTAMTTSGVIGIQIRVTAVSSGNIYDVNNGFELTLAQGNVGAPQKGFKLKGLTVDGELLDCQRDYCKSFELTTSPVLGIYPIFEGAVGGLCQVQSNNPINDGMVYFPCAGRIVDPAGITIISPTTGLTDKVHNYGLTGGPAYFAAETLDYDANVIALGPMSMIVYAVETAIPLHDRIAFHWVRDCRLP